MTLKMISDQVKVFTPPAQTQLFVCICLRTDGYCWNHTDITHLTLIKQMHKQDNQADKRASTPDAGQKHSSTVHVYRKHRLKRSTSENKTHSSDTNTCFTPKATSNLRRLKAAKTQQALCVKIKLVRSKKHRFFFRM